MLEGMEIAVGVLLGLAGLLLVGLVAAFVADLRAGTPTPPPPADPIDDLPDFLEFPPGSAGSARPRSDTVVALVPLPRTAAPPPTPRRPPVPTAAVAALTGLVVMLLVAAVIVAAFSGPGRRDRAAAVSTTVSAARGEARVQFGGIVLEERAVGITVSRPKLVVASDADGPVASLELPTWNCLAAEAPEDPADSGCRPGRTEYAELRSPDLQVTRDGDELRITGDFATSTRPTGSDPEPTGRSYELAVTVSPDGAAAPGRWVSAAGDLVLGDRRAPLVEGEVRLHG